MTGHQKAIAFEEAPLSYEAASALKGFLILTIIWDHIVLLHPLNMIRSSFISFPGLITSWLFFILSGYLTYSGYKTNKYSLTIPDTLRFFFNRAIRILPLFYFAILVIWLSYFYTSVKSIPPLSDMLRSIFFLDFNLFGGAHAITASWFLGIMVHFYLAAPLIMKGYVLAFGKLGTKWTFSLLIMASALCHAASYLLRGSTGGKFDTRNIIGFLPFFLFGFFAYDLYQDKRVALQSFLKSNLRKIIGLLIFFLLLEGAAIFYRLEPGDIPHRTLELLILGGGFLFLKGYVGILGMTLLLILMTATPIGLWIGSPQYSILKTAPRTLLINVGRYSLAIYIFHQALMDVFLRTRLIDLGGPPYESFPTRLLAFIVTVAMTYALARITHAFIERPFQTLYRERSSHPA